MFLEPKEHEGPGGETPGGNEGGGNDKDPGTDKPDEFDNNNNNNNNGGDSSGGRDRDRSVNVGRDVYINDLDIPLANELLNILEEEMPLAELSLFDIPDTGTTFQGLAMATAATAVAVAGLAYKKED